MIEFSRPDVSIEELKGKIREAVARREAEGRASFINASTELFKLLTAETVSWERPEALASQATELAPSLDEITLLKLQPDFFLRENGHYHANELLQYHDTAFIWNAYRAILKREPDEEGFQAYLSLLRSGRRNKIDILASLRRSAEGKRAQVSIDGLTMPAMVRRLYRLPLIGYVLELIVALARLPVLVRSQRQMENHFVGQQDRLAGHFNYTNRKLADEIARVVAEMKKLLDEEKDSFQNTLLELSARQDRITALQHQQVAALFSGQQKLIDNNRSFAASRPQTGKTNGFQPERRRGQVDLDQLEAAFADHFRGSPETVKEGLKPYLALLKDAGVTGEILDLGCGRGEWLEILREEALGAVGVESNQTLVAAGRSRGFEIIHQEAIAYLAGLPSNSLQAVTAFHLIEHLEFERLIELLSEVKRTLKPGGIVILETPNPKNLVVGACNFYADPTHHKPAFPDTLQFVLNRMGFQRTRIEYKNPVEGSPFEDSRPGSDELNIWLFGPRDYAAIGWKA